MFVDYYCPKCHQSIGWHYPTGDKHHYEVWVAFVNSWKVMHDCKLPVNEGKCLK